MLVDENECICALLIKFLAQMYVYFLAMNNKRCISSKVTLRIKARHLVHPSQSLLSFTKEGSKRQHEQNLSPRPPYL